MGAKIVVNRQTRIIFNGSFECSKTGKIGENFVENGLCGTRGFGLTMAVLTIMLDYGKFTAG
jgi:hypothetical protein